MDGLIMKYFILKPKGIDIYAQASRAAMRAYAEMVEKENIVLAVELRNSADTEETKAFVEAEAKSKP